MTKPYEERWKASDRGNANSYVFIEGEEGEMCAPEMARMLLEYARRHEAAANDAPGSGPLFECLGCGLFEFHAADCKLDALLGKAGVR